MELLLAYPSAKADGNNCENKLGYNCRWLQPKGNNCRTILDLFIAVGFSQRYKD
jgi:hypothetical protein